MMGYVLSLTAPADLESIWDYTVTHWGEAQAEHYTWDIQAACEALNNDTLISRSVDDIRADYGKVAVGSHVMFCRMQSDMVEIVRILHQSMECKAAYFWPPMDCQRQR